MGISPIKPGQLNHSSPAGPQLGSPPSTLNPSPAPPYTAQSFPGYGAPPGMAPPPSMPPPPGMTVPHPRTPKPANVGPPPRSGFVKTPNK